jgi:hypothetical protein
MIPLLLLWTACEPAPASPAADPVPDPTPWVYEEEVDPPVPLDAEALETGLAEVLTALLRADPMTLHAAFSRAQHAGDADCPVIYQHNNQPVVSGDCTSSTGWTYYGYALHNQVANLWVALDDTMLFHRTFAWETGFLRVFSPEGYELDVLGDDLYRDYDNADGVPSLYVYLWGDFTSTDPADADTWLADGMGVQLYVDIVDDPVAGPSSTWDGGLSRLGGTVVAAVLHDLVFTGSGTCTTEPSGSVDLLDPDGAWYTVTFDPETTCDGCGFATSDTGEIGTVCGDFTPFVDWELRPW